MNHLVGVGSGVWWGDVSVLEKGMRSALIYLVLVVVLRMTGKRVMAQFTTYDFVVILLLSNAVQNGLIGNDNSIFGGLVGAGFLLAVNAFVARTQFRWHWIDRIVQGGPTTIVDDGRMDQRGIDSLRLTPEEVAALLRAQNFHSAREIQHAEVEPTGALTIQARDPDKALNHMREVIERLARIETALGVSDPATQHGPSRRGTAGGSAPAG